MPKPVGAAVAALVLGALLSACHTECDEALTKLDEECGFNEDVGGDATAECNGYKACIAGCINDATCAEIAYVPAGSPYEECMYRCYLDAEPL